MKRWKNLAAEISELFFELSEHERVDATRDHVNTAYMREERAQVVKLETYRKEREEAQRQALAKRLRTAFRTAAASSRKEQFWKEKALRGYQAALKREGTVTRIIAGRIVRER